MRQNQLDFGWFNEKKTNNPASHPVNCWIILISFFFGAGLFNKIGYIYKILLLLHQPNSS